MTWREFQRLRSVAPVVGILSTAHAPVGEAMIWHTAAAWHDHLRSIGALRLANFWTRSKTGMHIEPGAPFFFKRAGSGSIVGYGIFQRKLVMAIGEAWKRYGQANGTATLDEQIMRAQEILGLQNAGPDTKIGCIELEDVEFFPEDRWVRLREFGISDNITFKKIPATVANEIVGQLRG